MGQQHCWSRFSGQCQHHVHQHQASKAEARPLACKQVGLCGRMRRDADFCLWSDCSEWARAAQGEQGRLTRGRGAAAAWVCLSPAVRHHQGTWLHGSDRLSKPCRHAPTSAVWGKGPRCRHQRPTASLENQSRLRTRPAVALQGACPLDRRRQAWVPGRRGCPSRRPKREV